MKTPSIAIIAALFICAGSGCSDSGETKVDRDGEKALDMVLDKDLPGNDGCLSIDSITGEYISINDGSTLNITKADKDKYRISLSLFRLTEIDDGIGSLNGDKLIFTGTDASENPISGEIAFNENTVILVFTDSTWDYLPSGTSYTFERNIRDNAQLQNDGTAYVELQRR